MWCALSWGPLGFGLGSRHGGFITEGVHWNDRGAGVVTRVSMTIITLLLKQAWSLFFPVQWLGDKGFVGTERVTVRLCLLAVTYCKHSSVQTATFQDRQVISDTFLQHAQVHVYAQRTVRVRSPYAHLVLRSPTVQTLHVQEQ